MQRILEPGEIESLDHIDPTRIRLPQPASLFAERAARLLQKAEGNPIGDYLRFIAALIQGQKVAAGKIQTAAPDAAVIALAQQHSMPLLPAADHIDPVWRDALDVLLAELASQTDAVPPALQDVLQSLRTMPADARDTLARRVLVGVLSEPTDLAAAPIVMAALQVMFADRASRLDLRDIPYTDPTTICPVCGTAPVAGVIRIGGKEAGLRYMHCGTCCTEWHMVRIKCSHCEGTKGIHYQGIEDAGDIVLAETCDSCHTYRKVVNMEKDPLAEPLADDLASLMLDLLMSETPFARSSANPFLPLADMDATPQSNA